MTNGGYIFGSTVDKERSDESSAAQRTHCQHGNENIQRRLRLYNTKHGTFTVYIELAELDSKIQPTGTTESRR